MKLDNDNIIAITGTVIIHIIALIILFFGVLRGYVPLDDGGTPVGFDDYVAVAGIFQPAPSTTVAQPAQPSPQPAQTPPQPPPRPTTPRPATQPSGERVITQEREPTVSVPETTNNIDAAAEENARREREENERRQREEEERRQEEIAAKNFGGSNTQENSQGSTTTGTSNTGSPFAYSSSSVGAGIGANFRGNGVSLGGDGIPALPEYNENEQGSIVINIVISPKGDVTSANIGQGTTIGNNTMRNKAIAAAKKNTYVIEDKNKVDNSYASITFRYTYK